MEGYYNIVNFPLIWVLDFFPKNVNQQKTVSMKFNLPSGAIAKTLWSVRVSCVCVCVCFGGRNKHIKVN